MSRSTCDESSLKVLVPGNNKAPFERENRLPSLLDKKLKSLSKSSSYSGNRCSNRFATEREYKTTSKNKCRTHHPAAKESTKPRHKPSSLKYQEFTNDKVSTTSERVGKTMQNHETSHGKKSLKYQIRNRSASNDGSGPHKGYNSALSNQKFKNVSLKDISREVAFGDWNEIPNKKAISEEFSRMQDHQIVPILKKVQKFSKVKNQTSGKACVERDYRAPSEGFQDPVSLKMGKRPLVPVANTTRTRMERRLVNTSSHVV